MCQDTPIEIPAEPSKAEAAAGTSSPMASLRPATMPVAVAVVGARGLRKAGVGSGPNPYCVVSIAGKSSSGFRTGTVISTLNPMWNFRGTLEDFTPGDDIVFEVRCKDVLHRERCLGRAKLVAEDFVNTGYDGQLDLEVPGSRKAATSKCSTQASSPSIRIRIDAPKIDDPRFPSAEDLEVASSVALAPPGAALGAPPSAEGGRLAQWLAAAAAGSQLSRSRSGGLVEVVEIAVPECCSSKCGRPERRSWGLCCWS